MAKEQSVFSRKNRNLSFSLLLWLFKVCLCELLIYMLVDFYPPHRGEGGELAGNELQTAGQTEALPWGVTVPLIFVLMVYLVWKVTNDSFSTFWL